VCDVDIINYLGINVDERKTDNRGRSGAVDCASDATMSILF